MIMSGLLFFVIIFDIITICWAMLDIAETWAKWR